MLKYPQLQNKVDTMPNPIQLAHSPDADDIFMYFAIKFGWVEPKGMHLPILD